MIKRWVWVVVVLGACASNHQNLQDKVDNLATQVARMQHDIEELQRTAASRAAKSEPAPAPAPVDDARLEQKIDELDRKIAALKPKAEAPRPARPELDKSKVYAVPVDGYPSQGPKDAKITMVAARDYACPFCEKSRSTLDALRQKYGADLRIVYRNLIVHPVVASVAAFASCAAAKQGQFDAFDNALWERGYKNRQFDTYTDAAPCWTTPAGCPTVDGFARDLHLKSDRFKRDLTSCATEVKADVTELMAIGAGATPTFFINGRFFQGAWPIEQFSVLIDEELAKANERIKAGAKQATYYKTWVLDKGEHKP